MSEEPIRVRATLVVSGPDGPHATRFGPGAQPASPDPHVCRRLVPEGTDPPTEVITEYAPAAERPPSYPAALPFLPNLGCWTTEHLDPAEPPGARWPCPDPRPVLAALVEQSTAAGWVSAGGSVELPGVVVPASVLRLERGHTTRMLITARMEEGCVVQLMDAPTAIAARMPV